MLALRAAAIYGLADGVSISTSFVCRVNGDESVNVRLKLALRVGGGEFLLVELDSFVADLDEPPDGGSSSASVQGKPFVEAPFSNGSFVNGDICSSSIETGARLLSNGFLTSSPGPAAIPLSIDVLPESRRLACCSRSITT